MSDREANITKIAKVKGKLGAVKLQCENRKLKLEAELQKEVPDASVLLAMKSATAEQMKILVRLSEEWEKVLDEDEDSPLDEFQDYTEKTTEAIEVCDIVINRINLFLEAQKPQKDDSKPETYDPSYLPLPNLPKYDGDNMTWENFWSTFETGVAHRKDYRDGYKMQILKGILKGAAFNMVNGYPCNDEGYKIAVEVLKFRFGGDKEAPLRILLDLHHHPSVPHRRDDLNNFYGMICMKLQNLKSFGKNLDDDGADFLLQGLLLSKLSDRTQRAMEAELGAKYPSSQQIIRGLVLVIRNLERNRSNPNQEQSSVKPKPKGWNKTEIGNFQVTTESANPKQSAENTSSEKTCMMCEGQHSHYRCPRYVDANARVKRAEAIGRCGKCLRPHSTSTCQVQLRKCLRCRKGKHHIFFCPNKPSCEENEKGGEKKVTVETCSIKMSEAEAVPTALPTAEVVLKDDKREKKARAFFDQGSQKTFILSSVVRALELKPHRQLNLTITGFTGSTSPKLYDVVRPLMQMGEVLVPIEAVVVDELPRKIHMDGLAKTMQLLKSKKIKLADPEISSDTVEDVSLLIGNNYCYKFITSIEQKEGVTLLNSPGGYLVTGELPEMFVQPQVANTASVLVLKLGVSHNPVEEEDQSNLPKLWDLESIGIHQEEYSPEENQAYDNYYQTVRYESNQYWVRLPFKVNRPHLPTNHRLSQKRLQGTLCQLRKNEKHLALYDDIIKDQTERGFIEIVPDAQVTPAMHYIPHFAVVKDSKTTPIRVVYDCSAKLNKQSASLNDCLYSGPSLTEKLGKVLLKFRTNPFAYCADISKAFLRVGLQEEDRDFTRFLWPADPRKPDSQLHTYRFRSVLFGATSSPFLLQATLNFHLEKSACAYADKIRDSLYVDNLQGSTLQESDLLEFYHSANKTMMEANMPLQEWHTNSTIVRDILQSQESQEDCVKILGIEWNTHDDHLQIKPVKFEVGEMTKRTLLKNISRVFDPLGLLCPLTVNSRILMQETWKTKCDWDEILPDEFQEKWKSIVQGYSGFSSISFPREACREECVYKLHVFCDASTKAYGAAAYMAEGTQPPRLLTAKTKVAPVKSKTLPQLELTALYVGVKLFKYITQTLKDISFGEVCIWTDSEVALRWVQSNESKNTYVRNRVSSIIEIGNKCRFLHVRSEENPADLLTRGMSVHQLRGNGLWFHGPPWLNEREEWPQQKLHVVLPCQVTIEEAPARLCPIEGSKYSNLPKLLRITQYVSKFISMVTGKNLLTSPLTYWLKTVQTEVYKPELDYVSDGKGKPPELVKKLGLFVKDGILRCKGRIDKAELPYSARFPILLPKKHWFTTRLIESMHKACKHGGVPDTLCKLREEYWIPQGRQSVKSVLRECYVCRRLEKSRCNYPAPPPLPEERVADLAPFEVTGVDYTGAINIHDSETDEWRKVYILLFTCATTRAVHLELAVDMSAETFLNVFRRFAARRSCPRIMISDNGTSFKSGASLLLPLMEDELVVNDMQGRNCQWKFIAPRAPWQGGFYERMVGIVKNCLRKTLYRSKLTIEELHTVTAEVENRVNNRPLTYVSDDINALEALTPSHLIHGRRLRSVPGILDSHEDDPGYLDSGSVNDRYKKLSKVINRWQDMWKKDYLTSLREKFYGLAPNKSNTNELEVGDVVIVQDTGPRAQWPLGRIEEKYPDEGGNVRLVKLKMKSGTVLRTVDKLVPLECDVDNVRETVEQSAEEEPSTSRPTRQAAIQFRNRLRELIASDEV